ncbi:dde superfamily endonuclease [Holotrichia oblita]|uniref:Dde superfamily endonuclease n=1 Tax=Holotrichia oblita TaxID=644536 RepID=A0ACB9TS71_HOLOL|nr:dde superfamily endonuclease [Holotrichia oblita]
MDVGGEFDADPHWWGKNNGDRGVGMPKMMSRPVEYTQLKENGTIKNWTCTNCERKETIKNREPVYSTEPGYKLEEFINNKINAAVREISNTIISSLKNEIEKLIAENKKILTEMNELKLQLNKDISTKKSEDKTEQIAIHTNSEQRQKEAKIREINTNVFMKRSVNGPEKFKKSPMQNTDMIIEDENERKADQTATFSQVLTQSKDANFGKTGQLNNNSWKTVTRRKQRQTIVGTSDNGNACTFSAAPQRRWYFVGGVNLSCATDSVKDYIAKNICIRMLEQLQKKKVLLVLDGHTTHSRNLEALELSRTHGIILLNLPGHTTHRIQPLDRTFFKPFKGFYNQAIQKWLRTKPGLSVIEYQVSGIVAEAYGKAATIENAMNGFKACGIWPVDRSVFNECDFYPAENLTSDNTDKTATPVDMVQIPQYANTGTHNEPNCSLDISQIQKMQTDLL